MLELCMLASGSAGNAVYIGTEKTKILIDAGLSRRRLTAALRRIRMLPVWMRCLFPMSIQTISRRRCPVQTV